MALRSSRRCSTTEMPFACIYIDCAKHNHDSDNKYMYRVVHIRCAKLHDIIRVSLSKKILYEYKRTLYLSNVTAPLALCFQILCGISSYKPTSRPLSPLANTTSSQFQIETRIVALTERWWSFWIQISVTKLNTDVLWYHPAGNRFFSTQTNIMPLLIPIWYTIFI
jgi:hypothetical protein